MLDPDASLLREIALREPGNVTSAPFGDGHAAETLVSFLAERR